jgi:hypothetical protein
MNNSETSAKLSMAYMTLSEATDFEVGESIKVVRTAEDGEMGWGDSWIHEMTEAVEEEHILKITNLGKNSNTGIELSDGNSYPFFVLMRVEPEEIEEETLYIGEHEVVFSEDDIQVGCQCIDNDTIKIVLERQGLL